MSQDLKINPVSHASMVIEFGGVTIYNDPVGGVESYVGLGDADVILVSDIHGDHFDVDTLSSLSNENTTIIVPQAVFDELPQNFSGKVRVLNNNESMEIDGLRVIAIPAYNIPESEDSYHTKGRGNGYLFEGNGKRVYIAGDTSDTPEMS